MSGAPPGRGPLWLASRSPRRRSMLEALGVPLRVHAAEIDDGRLDPGDSSPVAWVIALAYLKARWSADDLLRATPQAGGVVLGADTVCVQGDRILGQPRDGAEARRMLVGMRDAVHRTITGVCLVALPGRERWMMADGTTVRVGPLPDDVIDAYIASGGWRGKAGGYNLDDRRAAGWPVECTGDPSTVMGLPLARIGPWLRTIKTWAGERAVIAVVHLAPAWTVPVAALMAIAIARYWWSLGRSGVSGGRRRIRRMSMLVMFVAVPMLLAGLSFLDPETEGRRYVIVWSGAMFLMLLLFLTACLDGLYTIGSHRAQLEEEIIDAGAELRAILEARGERRSENGAPGDDEP